MDKLELPINLTYLGQRLSTRKAPANIKKADISNMSALFTPIRVTYNSFPCILNDGFWYLVYINKDIVWWALE